MTAKKPQLDKFREAARELEADERESNFDANLKKVATPAKTTQMGEGQKKPGKKPG